MLTRIKLAAASVVIATAVLTITGCNTQPHPNQISTFDGTCYDSLTLADGALTGLRLPISTSYPKYSGAFNDAVAAYAVALNSYSLYRTNPKGEAAVSAAIDNLATSIIIFENTVQADLHVSPGAVTNLQHRAKIIRDAARSKVTVSDILTVLELAAAIAETVPKTQPYSAIAVMVIAATNDALNAETLAAGKNIDLSTIQPVAAIQ